VKQNKIPPGWLNVKLGEVIELKYGKALPAQKRDGEKFPVYGSNGIVGYHSEPQIKGPALIVGRKGSIGEVHLSEEDCSCIDTTYFVDDFYGQPPVFWLNRLSCLNLAELNRATALPGLNRNDAYQLNLLFPPLKEQHRIVKKIEALQTRSSKARKALEAIPPLLEKFRQSVLSSAFRGDLTADWRAQNSDIEPAEKLLERIRKERRKRWEEDELAKMKAKGQTPKDDKWKKKYKEPEPVDTTDLPELPEGWCWINIETIGNVRGGKRLPKGSSLLNKDTGYPYIRAGNLKGGTVKGEIVFLREEDFERISRYTISSNDAYITIVGACIGDAGVIPTEFEGANLTENAAKICELIHYNNNFLGLVLQSTLLQKQIFGKILSAAQGKLALSRIAQLAVPLCSELEQKEILNMIQKLLGSAEKINEKVTATKELCNTIDQSILSKAFRGEIVPQDPNDEPASQLLKRIKLEKASLEAGKKQKGKAGRKKVIQKKEATAMAKKKEGRPLVEALQPHSSGLSPEELFQVKGLPHGGVRK
jgi:type I restriction enzyme S subunit